MAWLLSASVLLAQPQTWELRGDQFQPVEQSPTTRPAVESVPVIERAESLIGRGAYMSGKNLLVDWLNADRRAVERELRQRGLTTIEIEQYFQEETDWGHPLRDRAIYLVGEAYYRYGDRVRAFYHFDELMDQRPDSPLFYDALQRQYDIADAFLKGYRTRIFGIPLLTNEDVGIDMLFRIQLRSPGSPLAEKALLRTADYYFAGRQYDLAEDAYNAYVRSYPRSPLAARANLRQAFSNYAQFRGLRFDATPLLDARAQLMELIAQYPELANEENLPAFIERIDRELAQKLIVTADWYQRTNEPAAAAKYYRTVIEAYPQTEEARRAERELARLPRELQTPPPPLQQSPQPG
jgi:outer membrane assembly lipoprotein YfiO